MPGATGVVQEAGVPRRPSISTTQRRQEPKASRLSEAQSLGMDMPSSAAARITDVPSGTVTSKPSMVSVTDVEVSRDLSHAKVFFTQLGIDDAQQAKQTAEVLNKAAGFLRSQLAQSATMRTVPRLHFRFDESVGRGRDMESLLRDVREADLALKDSSSDDTEAS